MKFDSKAFLNIFTEEVSEYSEQLDLLLIALEKNINNKETHKQIYRLIHTVKGISGIVGFNDVSDLMHIVEDLFERIKSEKVAIDKKIVNELYHINDLLKTTITDLKNDKPFQVNFKTEIANFNKLIEQYTGTEDLLEEKIEKTVVYEFDLNDYKDKIVQNQSQDMKIFDIHCIIDKKEELKNSRKRILIKRLSPYGEVLDVYPKRKEDFNTKEELELKLLFLGEIDKRVLEEVKRIDRVRDFEYKELQLPEIKEIEELPAQSISSVMDQHTIKVKVTKLDSLLNYAQGLTISNLSLQNIIHQVNEDGYSSDILVSLTSVADTMSKTTHSLHQELIQTRMVPIGTLFSRFNRPVRDMAKSLNKQINLKISGQDENIDKNTIGLLFEPLLHLIRNAIDHGIETPEERNLLGKPEEATLEIGSYNKNDHLFIQVSDDGQGIDLEKIKAKALSKSIISEASNLNEEELLNLIFLPNFSTKEKANELAGRGIGMNIVKEAVKKLNGEIKIKTQRNKGTVFTISIPPTISIISVLIIQAGGERYALPLDSVSEIITVATDEIQTAINKKMLMHRDSVIPIISFEEFFDIEYNYINNGQTTIIVIESENKIFGLIVEKILKKEEIVTKSLTKNIIDAPGISGATILGDGIVALILDAGALAKQL